MMERSRPTYGQPITNKGAVERSQILHLFDAQVLDDDPTTVNSVDNGAFAAPMPSGTWDEFDLILQLDSTLAPTSIEFFVEWSPDGGTTWMHYAQGLFASLIYDDTVVASGLNQVFRGIVAGENMRLRVVALGSNATNFFTFSASIQFARK